MSLPGKLLLALLPPVLLCIALLGVWSTYNATQSQFQTWSVQMDGVMRACIENHLLPRHELGMRSGMIAGSADEDAHREAAEQLARDVLIPWAGDLLIFNGAGQAVYVPTGRNADWLAERWAPVVEAMAGQDVDSLRGALGSDGGDEYYSAIRFRPWNWFIVVTLDEGVIRETRNRMLRATSISGLLVAVILTLVVILALRTYFLRPVAELRKATRDIADNRRPMPPRLSPHDELGALARDIRNMGEVILESRAKLQRWNEMLEERVRRRTRALSSANDRLGESLRRSEAAEEALRRYQAVEKVDISGFHTKDLLTAATGMRLLGCSSCTAKTSNIQPDFV